MALDRHPCAPSSNFNVAPWPVQTSGGHCFRLGQGARRRLGTLAQRVRRLRRARGGTQHAPPCAAMAERREERMHRRCATLAVLRPCPWGHNRASAHVSGTRSQDRVCTHTHEHGHAARPSRTHMVLCGCRARCKETQRVTSDQSPQPTRLASAWSRWGLRDAAFRAWEARRSARGAR